MELVYLTYIDDYTNFQSNDTMASMFFFFFFNFDAKFVNFHKANVKFKNCNNSVTILVKPLKFCTALYIFMIFNDYQILNNFTTLISLLQ